MKFCLLDYGLFKIEAKTKTSTGVEFTANGNSNHESGKVAGALETKYKWSEYGKERVENYILFSSFKLEGYV